jgi:glycosyltransferase involved in cell wall biosynthesis
MRVIYDYQIFSLQQYGGISRYYCELGSRINQLPDSEARFLAGLHINQYLTGSNADLTIGYLRPQQRVLDRACAAINQQWTNFYLTTQPPDILHYTSYRTYQPAASTVKVLTVYDMIHERFPGDLSPAEASVVERQKWPMMHERYVQEKYRAVQVADYILCPSESTKRDVVEFLGVEPELIKVIYHGCGVTPPAPVLPSSCPKPYILFVGNRVWYKNFNRLLAAFVSQPSFAEDFDLVAFSPKTLSAEELVTIDQLGLSRSSVIWRTGSDAELMGFYQQAALFVYPSLYEGFGYPPLEAMVAGCPVACSKTSCFPETVADAAELFDPYDVDDIARGMRAVLYDPQRTKDLIKSGYQRCQQFSWQTCAEDHLAFYRSLLAAKG